ncbi:MAG TPA: SRPBCC family protein [Chloroflexota bacterium]|nr:SRPBCC family protein [Chloroflexota bacterium]
MATQLRTRRRGFGQAVTEEQPPGPVGQLPGRLERVLPALGGTAMALMGLTRRSPSGLAMAVAGSAIAYRAATGHAPLPNWVTSRLPRQGVQGLVVDRGFTVLRPREELYQFWRNFENLPHFMTYLKSVTPSGDGRSHWVAAGPAASTVHWDAEIVEDRPNELIRWQSIAGSQVANRGEVRFDPAPGDRGTEVRVHLEYEPPAGVVGATIAQVLGQGADRQVRESLRQFKSLMEAHEIPTNDDQPWGTCLLS